MEVTEYPRGKDSDLHYTSFTSITIISLFVLTLKITVSEDRSSPFLPHQAP